MKAVAASLLLLAFLGLGAAGLWWGPDLVRQTRERWTREDPLGVWLQHPARGEFVETVQAPGQTRPASSVKISARFSARVIALPYAEGGQVKSGDIVVKLDAADLEAELRGAEARRAADEARLRVEEVRLESMQASEAAIAPQLEDAQQNLKRQEQLLRSGDVGQAVTDTARARVAQLQAERNAQERTSEAARLNLVVMQRNLDAADAEIARVREVLEHAIIRAPMAGVVTRLNAEVGETVITGTMNNPGTVIMEIADLSTIEVEAQIDESMVGTVHTGQTARIRLNAYPDQVFAGRIGFIDLTPTVISGGTKAFNAQVSLDANGLTLYSGLTADVEIETRRHQDVLKVPSQAVMTRPNRAVPLNVREGNPCVDPAKAYVTVVFRRQQDHAVATPVAIGPTDVSHTVILDGLQETDEIIVGPYKLLDTLQHGKLVTAERQTEPTPADVAPGN